MEQGFLKLTLKTTIGLQLPSGIFQLQNSYSRSLSIAWIVYILFRLQFIDIKTKGIGCHI